MDNHSFLFMAKENAIFEIDPETRDILSRLSGKGDLSRNEIMALLNGRGDEKDLFFEELLDRRVLLPVAEEKYDHTGFDADPAILPLNTLVLQVTDACNLGCLYCYYSQEKKPVKKKGPMSIGVARQAIDFLFKQSGDLEEMCLVFFGGEPFLNFTLISQAVHYALEKVEGSGKKISFAVTTNGTLLSEEAVSFLYENQTGITVSIDGLETMHDRYRPFPDGTPSYGVILQNIKNLFRIYRDIPVPARVTVAGSSEHVSETLDHLLNLGFAEVGFAPVTTKDPAFRLDSEGMSRLLKQFQDLSKRFLELALDDRLLGFSNLIDLLAVLHEGEVKNYPCGAGLGLFSVDPEGGLYLCQRLTGEEACYMGDIFSGFDESRLTNFREKAVVDQKESCVDCWVRNICAGGCYHEALVREGGLMKANLHYCRWIKEWVETGIRIYCELSLVRPEYLDKLSLLRAS